MGSQNYYRALMLLIALLALSGCVSESSNVTVPSQQVPVKKVNQPVTVEPIVEETSSTDAVEEVESSDILEIVEEIFEDPEPIVPEPVVPIEPIILVAPTSNCHPGYSGCLKADASDYDCAGGSGNGPFYTGKVQVFGNDPFGLDRDHDGWGCE